MLYYDAIDDFVLILVVSNLKLDSGAFNLC